ncbi:MAG: hypothetical protein SFV81_13755 [Pirellulaceae bacterium]|nr:hypothetical protein [Pirellulaceae bacterium]
MNAFLSNWLLLYPVAFSLYVAMQLSEATADGRKASIGVLVMRTTIFILFIFSLLAVGCRTSVLSIVWAVLFGVLGIVLLVKQSKLSRSSVTMTILGCRDLPQIKRAVQFFAEEFGGLLGRKLRYFGLQLHHGIPWSTALESAGFCSGSYERLATRLAARFGTSANTSQDLNAPLRVEIEMERLLSRLSILVWILFFGPVFALYMTVVVPTLRKMLQEFEVAIPRALIAVSSFETLGWLFGGVSLFALLFFGFAVLLWLFPRLTSKLPFRLLCGSYYRCLGFVALSRVSDHTEDLTEACRQAAVLIPVKHIATKFRTAATCLERGYSPTDAFATAKLVRGNRLGDFASILNTAGVAWATNQLATVEVERMLNRYSLVVQFLVVVFTLFFAVLVGLVAVGMFEALSTMIQSLA